jgi:hypothetical protein
LSGKRNKIIGTTVNGATVLGARAIPSAALKYTKRMKSDGEARYLWAAQKAEDIVTSSVINILYSMQLLRIEKP